MDAFFQPVMLPFFHFNWSGIKYLVDAGGEFLMRMLPFPLILQ